MAIKEISSEDIHTLKSHITVDIPLKNNRSNYKVGWWLTNEGNTEGLSEVWLDKFFEPQDINTMTRDELSGLPNFSPIDVVAVLKQKKRGPIRGTFELKNSPGISYYGYKNLLDFIKFPNDQNSPSKFHFRYSHLIRSFTVAESSDDINNDLSHFLLNQDKSRPEVFTKASVRYGNNIKVGIAYHKYVGEEDIEYSDIIKEGKKFVFIDDISQLFNKSYNIYNFNSNQYDSFKFPKLSLILGNYTVAFGQGVVMETNDDFSPRRTGFGFTKKSSGILPDATRSTQYVMNGLALQLTTSSLRTVFFISKSPRDAIINSDSSFTSLITMKPRLDYGFNNDSTKFFESLKNSVSEVTWGWNIRLSPILNSHIGFTFYESLYDRYLIPDVIGSITGGVDDSDPNIDVSDYDDYSGDVYYLQYVTNSADPELNAMYSSVGSSELWDSAKAYRRVIGFDFSTVIGNIALQGEIGRFYNYDKNIFNFNSEPKALVLNAYTQFNNLNLLVLYRDYDLQFDNPYQRSFSNYQRFKTTILEDEYWLEDPILKGLYENNAQPQAERGLYIQSRYQFHRSFIGYLNWDNWLRKADRTYYFRTVATIEWRPVFNYRVKIRQKWQGRGVFDVMHPSPYDSRETRISAELRLSRYNKIKLFYINGYTTFSPRPRLTDNGIIGADMMVGDINSPQESIGFDIIHNVRDNLSIKGGVMFIDGFVWYHEDTDFRVFDAQSPMVHSWIAFHTKIGNNLSLQIKCSHSIDETSTNISSVQTTSGYWMSNPVVNKEDTSYRIQIDYTL